MIIKQITYFREVLLKAEKLRVLIKSHGFTIKSFGERLDMTREGVYDILKRKYLKPDLIQKICKVLTTQPEEFIEYEFSEDVKKKLHALETSQTADLEKEILRLKEVIDGKDKIIDAQQKALTMAEQLILKSNKKIAQVIQPKKN